MNREWFRELQTLHPPTAVGLVIAKYDEEISACPVTCQMVSSIHETPLTVSFWLSNASYTLSELLQAGEFVFAYPSLAQLKDILYLGRVSGRDTDKLANTSLEFTRSKMINTPSLMGAVVNHECKYSTHIDRGRFQAVFGDIQPNPDHEPVADKSGLDKIYWLGGPLDNQDNYGAIRKVEILQSGRDGQQVPDELNSQLEPL